MFGGLFIIHLKLSILILLHIIDIDFEMITSSDFKLQNWLTYIDLCLFKQSNFHFFIILAVFLM